ncbi:DUF3080 domain-containing protein [Salinivibrio sp. ES.052]|uniref:DUF3080 domain-containing protein n=1 Tax=Salinivibrio sp. ES.052 TaxID=1882823 RepID=UPI0009258851|nr:DUF3080 domain-containing protein [Salinivibrio sp. ES.052]SIN87204.1 Protein of unknown function [Salinivibrio sp. ES.052]
MRGLKTILLLITLVGLVGCQSDDPAKAMMADYYQRLGNVLDAPTPDFKTPAVPTLPRKRELVQPLDALRMGVLDAYELRQCGLFNLIAERNSSLGKVADRFRQLDYELNFLRIAEQCLPKVKDPSIQSELEQALARKREQRDTVIWNTLIDSDAWRGQLSLPTHTLPIELPAHSNAISTIEQFSQLLDNSPAPNESVIDWQESIEKQRILGALFVSLSNHTAWLNQTSELIANHQEKVLCGGNFDTTRLERLQTVFYKFYVGDVQPYLARVDGLYRDLSPALSRFNQLQTPDAFSAYKNAYWQGEAYHQYKNAIKHHADVWQQLFQRCDVKLGQ